MSDPTPSTSSSRTDALWRIIVAALFVVAIIVAIGSPLITGNWQSVLSAAPAFAFAILIAAIRSIRR